MTVFELLKMLDARNIHYGLARYADDQLNVNITIVGLRIEVAFFEGGRVEYSTFRGDEGVETSSAGLIALIDEETRGD
jgi:hypothetical protein